MKITLTIKNYRCFADSSPATITLDRDFIAVLGVNNAGKSSLLRFFYEMRNLFGRFVGGGDEELARAFGTGTMSFNYPNPPVLDPLEIFTKDNPRDLEIRLSLQRGEFQREQAASIPSAIIFTIERGQNTVRLRAVMERDPIRMNSAEIARVPDQQGRLCLKDGNALVADLTPYREACQLLADTLYIGSFRNAINVGGGASYFDIQIGQSFIGQWDNQKNGHSRREAEATHQLEQAIAHIFDFRSLQINATPTRDTLQVFVDGRAYRLNELGSGLAQFLVVLANAAVKRPAYVLIDEPELNLHPSLQLDFLTTLGSFAKCGVVFATHSYGLARAAAETIYTVQRRDGASQLHLLEQAPRLSQLLGELSYGGYTALGFGQVLLVEGTTEVKAVQQLLRLYGKDHKVLVLPMGGSSLINGASDTEAALTEIKRITPQIAAVVDSEKASATDPLPPDRLEFKDLCARLGIRCHVLERRAFENYFTQPAIDKAEFRKFRAPGLFDKMKDANPGWSKSWNWRVARQLELAEVDATDLGGFLRAL